MSAKGVINILNWSQLVKLSKEKLFLLHTVYIYNATIIVILCILKSLNINLKGTTKTGYQLHCCT